MCLRLQTYLAQNTTPPDGGVEIGVVFIFVVIWKCGLELTGSDKTEVC